MATDTALREVESDDPPPQRRRPAPAQKSIVRTVLEAFASLKLTVTLFALAVFLVFAGTLAQTRHDIWWVMYNYFRTPLVWIELNVFFPPAWFSGSPTLLNLPGAFPFPGGFTVGGLMAINLLAAHGLRFKIQAAGTRLWSGAGVIGLGCLLTWLVIVSGPGDDGMQNTMPVAWTTVWRLFLLGLGIVCAGIAAALFMMGPERKAERRVLGIVGAALLVLLGYLMFKIDITAIDPDAMISSMRILWQVGQASVAALVLLAGCLMVFRRRAGVVLLHAGIGLIMANELVVYSLHKEAQMTMAEKESTSYASDIREVELAVIDPAYSATEDDVVVVPERLLLDSQQHSKPIRDGRLPVEVQVKEYFENATVSELKPGEKNPGDAGLARTAVIERLKPVVGTDSNKHNYPAAYVELLEKGTGKSLGTYLTSAQLVRPEPVEIDGKQYGISLRFQRDYKPYFMQLEDVKAEMYPGTAIPQKYESKLTLLDDARKTDRKVRVRMNEPLRYGGETFYQSGYFRDPRTETEHTTLQVVTNAGWMIPYVGCVIVAVGMLAHMSLILVRFIRRREEGRLPAEEQAQWGSIVAAGDDEIVEMASARAPLVQRALPWIVVLGAIGLLANAALRSGPSIQPNPLAPAMDLEAFGNLPVLSGGRVQPVDSLARNTLRMISLRDVYRDEGGGLGMTLKDDDGKLIVARVSPDGAAHQAGIKAGDRIVELAGKTIDRTTLSKAVEAMEVATVWPIAGGKVKLKVATGDQAPRALSVPFDYQPAVKWLLDLATRPEVAQNLRIFRIDNPDLLAMLGLERRKYYRYSWAEFAKGKAELDKARAELKDRDAASFTVYEKKLAELDNRSTLHEVVRNSFLHGPLPPLPTKEEYEADPEGATQTMREIRGRLEFLPNLQSILSEHGAPLAVPPASEKRADGDETEVQEPWRPYVVASMLKYLATVRGDQPNPAAVAWENIFNAYADRNAAAFNRAVGDYARLMQKAPPEQLTEANPAFEAWFNHWGVFADCQWLYFVAFCLAAFGWLGWRGPLNRSAFWLIAVVFVVHTFALGARMYISGRPPVTNLYSSAIFIGWAAVLAGLILESVYRLGFGNVLASIAGFATLLIADKLSLVLDLQTRGDTVGVMQAVLDTQFWLATHVTCITLGYTATYVAGLLGVIYVVRGLLTPSLTAVEGKDLARMIYGAICFGVFFSLVGTVLGGLWADDSWGRFWGWDPKENGALIIVLWNALLLHARWDGLVKDRGLALLAIGGNIVTSWSWFGVNQLGVGLHSYGFTEGVLVALAVFCASQLALIAAGLLPAPLLAQPVGVGGLCPVFVTSMRPRRYRSGTPEIFVAFGAFVVAYGNLGVEGNLGN